MLTLAATDNLAAKQDVGTDVLFNLSSMDITNSSGLGVASTAQGALGITAAALITSPASGHSLVISNLKITNTAAVTRTVTFYKDSAGTTYDATTQWGTPIVLFAGESAEWTSAGWVVYDANGVPKFASARWPFLVEGTEPATPLAGFVIPWVDANEIVWVKDDNANNWSLSQTGRQANYVINGEFDYAQRQAPGTATTYSNTTGRAYGADRWGVTNENASVTYTRIDTSGAVESGCQARFYGKYFKITATGKIIISQVVEAGNALHLRGHKVRVQAKIKADAARTVRIALLQLTAAGTVDTIPATFASAFGANTTDPTWGTNLSKITAPTNPDNCTVRNDGLDCSVTTAWQRFSGVFTVPTDVKNLIVVIFSDSQVTLTTGFIAATEVGLYDGTEIRDWNPRPQAEQLENCQRFYQKSFNVDTAPAQNVGLAGAVKGNVSIAAAAAGVDAFVRFHTRMYKAGTYTFYNPSAANAFLRNTTAATDATATSSTNASEAGSEVTATGLAAWTVAQSTAVHFSVDAEL